jgi:DNA segregation ATPase FtsK/SpoIIIE-like protein
MSQQSNPLEELACIPLTGGLVNAILSGFCATPVKGDDSWPECSIGVGDDSVVATDSMSAIHLGKSGGEHEATQLKKAQIEAFAAKTETRIADLVAIERLRSADGTVQLMPSAESLIQRHLSKMVPIAGVAALVAIGRVAAAAGAQSVELFQREDGGEVLGFRFVFTTDIANNLFSSHGDIEARGIFQASRSRLGTHPASGTLEAEEVANVPAQAKKSKKKAAEAAEDPAPEFPSTPKAEPEAIAVDTAAEVFRGHWKLPPIGILQTPDESEVESGDYGPRILETLHSFGLSGLISGAHTGPTITQYELVIRGGIPAKRILQMADDLQMRLEVVSVRIQAPIPGKNAIGVEVPNAKPRTVSLFEVCAVPAFAHSEKRLVVAMGLDTSGKAIHSDVEKLTHLLIGGATNAGKSISVATILSSLLLRNSPEDLRLVLIDPKRVELAFFADLPHLMYPVITDMGEVAGVLTQLVDLMEARYEELEKSGVRNITSYRQKHPDEKMPFVVVVVDELADLIMQDKANRQKDDDEPRCEDLIVRLAQKARAVGIHLVLATQRPSVDVCTGLIKANVPSRLALKTASGIDSKVILDQTGAENLVGKGDMLFSPMDGGGKLTRLQGAYVSEEEVEAICGFWRRQGKTSYEIQLPEEPQRDSAAVEIGITALKDAVKRGRGRPRK